MTPPQHAIVAGGWFLWLVPFFQTKRPGTPVKVDRRARWGLALQCLAYSVLWCGPSWRMTSGVWQEVASGLLFVLGSALSWAAVRALGRHWRLDAGLSAKHELVVDGAYRLVRHPIYASMLLMLLGTGLMVTPWLRFAIAAVIFLAGTEIRVRIEDSLLALRFGSQFTDYERHVPAYIPGVR